MEQIEKAIFQGKSCNPEHLKKLKETFQTIEKHMKGKNWLANQKMTLADLVVFDASALAF